MPVEMTPLADASARGNVAIVELLVESRAEVNATGLVRREGREGGREGREGGGREGEGRRNKGKEGRREVRGEEEKEGGREGGFSILIHTCICGWPQKIFNPPYPDLKAGHPVPSWYLKI